MTREIGLVSCVKTKQESPAPPKELYTSPYFEKMRSYAEQNHDDWYILSAKYGLLDPDGEQIEPYDLTLRDVSKAERREWSEAVYQDLDERNLIEEGTVFVFHAGKPYYEELLPKLDETDALVEIPTEGFQFGDTQAWYKERL
jgi:hypothetical protein